MKYYIILQPTIRAMGGEEMYTRNIIVSAREKGYLPIIFHSGIGGDKIYIDDLKQYDEYEFPAFKYEPCVVSAYGKKRLLRRIKNILVDLDENSIIESHEVLVAEWGEWLASQLGVRHFVYMLLEHNTLSFQPLYEFFRFKYDRHELAGIRMETIPDMFVKFAPNITGYKLPAYCANVYEDIPCPPQFKLGKADYTIGTIGRTNKRYVQPMIDSVINFVSIHQDKTFNILYVGGAMDKQSEVSVKNRLSSIPNVKLTFTGMLFPLSVELIRQMDVCLASAGSCAVSYNCGIPTISIDGNDSKAIGIFKQTTNNTLFRDVAELPLEIEDLLEEVLIEKKFARENRMELVDVDFSSHWDFIKQMSSTKEYYNISSIVLPYKERIKSRFLGFYYGLNPSSLFGKSVGKMIRHFSS